MIYYLTTLDWTTNKLTNMKNTEESTNFSIPKFIFGAAFVASIIGNVVLFNKNNTLRANNETLNSTCLTTEGLPQNVIPIDSAFSLIDAHQQKVFNGKSTSVFVPWNDFLSYLTYAKNGMEATKDSISGLEFYFAAYTDTGSNSTLVVYPTFFDSDSVFVTGRNDGHIPYDFGQGVSVSELYRNRGSIDPNISINVAYNRMGQSPPRLPSTLGN